MPCLSFFIWIVHNAGDQYQQAGHLVDCPPEVDTELKQRLKARLKHAKALPAR